MARIMKKNTFLMSPHLGKMHIIQLLTAQQLHCDQIEVTDQVNCTVTGMTMALYNHLPCVVHNSEQRAVVSHNLKVWSCFKFAV